MEQPLITAIIPTYKRPHWLKRAVRSFLSQTFPDFIVLIADNSSGPETDCAVQQLMKQDRRVKLLQHPTNIGLTATLQMALMHTTTPYVCFLPDDDFVGPSFFEETLPKFKEYPNIALSGGGGLLINEKFETKKITANKQTIPVSGFYPAPQGLFAYLHSSYGIGFSGCLFKTECAKEVGGFDQRIRIGVDIDLVAKCAAKFPVYFLTDRPFYFAFQHGGSLSLTRNAASDEKEVGYLHENIGALLSHQTEKHALEAFYKKREYKILSYGYNDFCKAKNFGEARLCAEKLCLLTHSFRWKRKKVEASLFALLLLFYRCISSVKTLEKKLRTLGRKRRNTHINTSHIPEDAARWKEYALSLEKNE